MSSNLKVSYDISNKKRIGQKVKFCLSVAVYTDTPHEFIPIEDILDELGDLIYANEIENLQLLVDDGMFCELLESDVDKLTRPSNKNLRLVSFGAMTPLSKLRNAKGYDAFIRWYKNKD